MRLVRFRRKVGDFLFRFYPPEALDKLADEWLEDGRLEDALAAYTLADHKYTAKRGRVDPLAVGVRARRAWCLSQLGRRGEAIEVSREALAAKRESGDQQPPTVEELSERLRNLTG